MVITPLQYLLRSGQIDPALARVPLGVNRTTLWRWLKGVSYPKEPQKVIDYCSNLALLIEGEKYELDYNGIFCPSIRVSEDFFDLDHAIDIYSPSDSCSEISILPNSDR